MVICVDGARFNRYALRLINPEGLVMTSRQTEAGTSAVEVLTDFARATGQDFPVISDRAQQLALEIALWLRNNPGQPNND